MTYAEIWPVLPTMSRADKLRLVQSLVADLAQEDGVPLIEADGNYPIWTPLDANEAATTLTRLLEETRGIS